MGYGKKSHDRHQKLKEAYEALEKDLKERGEVLPTDDTGATYYNPATQKRERLLPLFDQDRRNPTVLDSDPRTLYEQEVDFREKYAFLAPFEIEVLVHKFVYSRTLEVTKTKIGFDNISSVYRVYTSALKKIKEKKETQDAGL